MSCQYYFQRGREATATRLSLINKIGSQSIHTSKIQSKKTHKLLLLYSCSSTENNRNLSYFSFPFPQAAPLNQLKIPVVGYT